MYIIKPAESRMDCGVIAVVMMAKHDDFYIYSPLMSISDAAGYLGVSRKTVYQLIEWDEIRAVKDGKAVRIEKKSLDEFRKSGKLT